MRRIALLVITALVLVAAPVASHSAAAWTARAADFPNTALEQDLRVTMSDGVRLAVDVVHPADANGVAAPGRFPVLLTQTPYNKASLLNFRDNYLVQRGYVQVIADVRGTGGSEGVWDSFGTREQRDGYELVRWAAAQPWSDGNVGLHGTSYGAINQLLTAAQHPAGLKATFPIVPMGDAFRDISFSGGEENTSFIPSWLGLVTALGLLPPTYTGNDPVGAAVAVAGHAGGIAQFQATAVAKGVTGGDTAYDGPFYRQRSPIERIDDVQVPTAIVGGLWDLFQRGEPMLFNRLRANGVPATLLIGPWYHVDAGAAQLNGLPKEGVPTTDDQELRWMDHFVRGVPDAELDDIIANKPVTYYMLGDEHYHTAASYPPPGVSYGQLFLSGNASPAANGSLSADAPATSSPDLQPWLPVSGPCSRSTAQWSAAGAHQGCEEDERANDAVNSLNYDTTPVTAARDLTGPVSAHLYVSTTASDAFVTARLEDVSPSGAVRELTSGWSMLSARALDPEKTVVDPSTELVVQPYHPFTKDAEQQIVAGNVYDLWVEIFPTSARLLPGHALRLSIQPSDTPHLSPSTPKTAQLAGGILSLYHDAAHPSSLVLPFVP